jgi:hypothetical protein
MSGKQHFQWSVASGCSGNPANWVHEWIERVANCGPSRGQETSWGKSGAGLRGLDVSHEADLRLQNEIEKLAPIQQIKNYCRLPDYHPGEFCGGIFGLTPAAEGTRFSKHRPPGREVATC